MLTSSGGDNLLTARRKHSHSRPMQFHQRFMALVNDFFNGQWIRMSAKPQMAQFIGIVM